MSDFTNEQAIVFDMYCEALKNTEMYAADMLASEKQARHREIMINVIQHGLHDETLTEEEEEVLLGELAHNEEMRKYNLRGVDIWKTQTKAWRKKADALRQMLIYSCVATEDIDIEVARRNGKCGREQKSTFAKEA